MESTASGPASGSHRRAAKVFVFYFDIFSMVFINVQEAMENFVFPDEIKTKMMKIDKT